MIVGLDHIQLAMPPGGEATACEFYGRLLGLRQVPKPTSLANRGGAWFESDNLQLHLGVEEDFRPARKAHPAFLVADLGRLTATLSAAGYDVRDDTEIVSVRRAFTSDPFENRIELIQYASEPQR